MKTALGIITIRRGSCQTWTTISKGSNLISKRLRKQINKNRARSEATLNLFKAVWKSFTTIFQRLRSRRLWIHPLQSSRRKKKSFPLQTNPCLKVNNPLNGRKSLKNKHSRKWKGMSQGGSQTHWQKNRMRRLSKTILSPMKTILNPMKTMNPMKTVKTILQKHRESISNTLWKRKIPKKYILNSKQRKFNLKNLLC